MSILGLGNPRGSGFRVGSQMGRGEEYRGQFMSNPRKRWTHPVTARRVPSKWKWKEGEQGEQREQGDNRVHNLSILCI